MWTPAKRIPRGVFSGCGRGNGQRKAACPRVCNRRLHLLLLEQRRGPEAITAIIHELPKVKFPDGKALLKMVRQHTGLDLRQLARTFRSPNLGFETRTDAQGRPEVEKFAPGSWAARADLLKGDVLLGANGCLVAGPVDVELEILKALETNQRLSFAFCRNGERHQTEALPLPANKPR